MFPDVAFFLLAGLAALFPIVLWGYAFSYLDADRFNARRFVLGIVTGAAAVFPIAFMPEVSSALPFLGNVFASIADRMSALAVSTAFAVFLATVSAIVLIAAFIIRSSSIFDDGRPIFRSLVAVGLSVPFFFSVASVFMGDSNGIDPEVRIAGATLAGFASILLAYLVVASVEEGGKHLGTYGTGSYADIASKGVLYAAFVALGFAFAENVLYLSSILRSEAPFSSFFSTWFSRSLFSVGVHTLCSVAAAVPFVRAAREGAADARAVSLAAKGLLIAVMLHATFDVTVSYGKTGIVFLYAVIAYAFLTRAFHRPEAKGS
ncbi:MAG: hypothetical protein QG650_367 [Patescibacteria group bacterium]|nr:hypothetical protein [Patescibacteria group bacterium]